MVLLPGEVEPPSAPDFERLPGLQRQPDDIVLLQHSSGTTGLQKGVALSHRAVANQLRAYSAAIRLSPQDVIVSWLPLYHDMGLIAGFLMPLLSGVKLVLMSPFDWVRAPARLLQAVSTYRGTLSWLPNFAYNFLAQKVRDRDLQGVDLSSWRAVINCPSRCATSRTGLFWSASVNTGCVNGAGHLLRHGRERLRRHPGWHRRPVSTRSGWTCAERQAVPARKATR